MTIRSIVATVLVTVGCAGLIACAGASKPRTTGQAPEAADAQPYTPEVADISKYYEEIREWRVKAGLPPEPLDSNVLQFQDQPLAKPAVCEDEHPTEGPCSQVCDLSEHICENAVAICDLANDMPGNSWAADKCSKAKASCEEAEKACCNCDESKLPGGGGDDDGDPEANNRFWN